jgi:hypothetical protein
MHARTIVSDRLVHSNALIVTEDLTNKVVAWAIEIASYAAQAEDATPRDAAIVADACVDAARRIMIELLALRAGAPQGRA